MTEKLASEIMELLKSTKSFAIEQMPDVVIQKIAYDSIVFISLGIVSGIAFIIFTIMFLVDFIKYETVSFSALFSVLAGIIASVSWLTYLQIQMATKVYILEWIKGFI